MKHKHEHEDENIPYANVTGYATSTANLRYVPRIHYEMETMPFFKASGKYNIAKV